jgi:photosystem II stability/assembly factor-like uncharacterized protein
MRKVTLCLILLGLIAPACGADGAIPTLSKPSTRTISTATAEMTADRLPTSAGPTPVASPIPSVPASPSQPTAEATRSIPTLTAPAQKGLPIGPLMIEGLQAIPLIGDPQLSNSFYAVTPAGLYITRDGGLNWAQVTTSPLQDNFVFSLAEPGILFAGAGADCYRGGPDQPLFKSINGGATWTELPDGINLRPVAVHPFDPNRLWAIGCAGPAFSSDGGDNWTTVSNDLFLIYDVSQILPSPTDPAGSVGSDWSVVYIAGVSEGGSGVIARSQDGGENWTPLLRESPEQTLWWITDLLVLPASLQQILLIDPHGVWRSSDAGEAWELFNAGLEDVIYQDGADFSTIGLNTLAVDSDTAPKIYLGTAQGVYQSLDGGETWAKVTGPTWQNAPIRDLALSSDLSQAEPVESTRQLFVTTDEGVFVFEP